MPRLFTGIELPYEVRDQICELKQQMPGVRWVDREDLHLTLRFLGDVDKRTMNEFAQLASEINHVGLFCAQLKGLSTFGGKEPRILWAGVEVQGLELSQLARAHERAAQAVGLEPEKRKFHPHVTIARLSYPRDEALARFLARNSTFSSIPFHVDHATLFSARPKRGGGPYVVEDNFPLGGVLAMMAELQNRDDV